MNDNRTTFRHDPHEEFEELAAGYAFDALSPEDAARFREHVATCADCPRLLAENRAIVHLLPLALDEREASPDLRDRLLSAARTEPPATAPPTETPRMALAPAPTPLPTRPAGRTPPWLLAAAAVLLLALGGLGFWNLQLQQQLTQQAQQARLQQEALTALAAGGRQWTLAGTEQAPAAGGVVIQDPGAERPLVVVRNLPALGPNQVYCAWVIRGGAPVPAGILRTGPDGQGILRLAEPLTGADQVAFTIEPAGGRPAPTGPIVVAGEL